MQEKHIDKCCKVATWVSAAMEHSRLNMEDYKILRQLGLGSYGSAHLAVHIPSDTKCVIKEINISHMSAKELEEARREVKVLSSLSHPYITQFRASCEENGRLRIAMDYCGGGDLHTLITSRKGVLFPEERVLDWFVQLCLAIKYIHDRKILHRDIKSQNIFLTDDGKIRLGDFGIAKVLNSTSDLARTCIGTPYYLSPEMCENKPYNNKSDIWALGCVLYEMMTLKHAFEANNMKTLILKIIRGIYQPVPTRYSRDLRLLLGQIFQREPQVRPSISVILRRTFILKKVPRFISGCEEEELKASLMKRRCVLPASARKIPVMKRPHDITDPSAKYGISQSFNKKNTYRSPTKSSSKFSRQAISGTKKAIGVAQTKIAGLNQEHRKKYQSENSLLVKNAGKAELAENTEKRSQGRSKSVPHAFKQSNSKHQNQNAKKKALSPVKLKLMLDSAGFKKNDDLNRKRSNTDQNSCKSKDKEESNKSPGAEGWLVDEFLSKKLQAAYNDRKFVEALIPTDSSESEFASLESGTPTRFFSTTKYDMCWVSKDIHVCRSSKSSGRAENKTVSHAHNADHIEIDQTHSSSDEQLQETNRKDVKELANKTLKQHCSNCSDEDDNEDFPALSADKVRVLMHEKMKKLLQERTEKMNQMVSERRQWAYHKEKLESAIVKHEEDILLLESLNKHNANYEIEIKEDFQPYESPSSYWFPCESKVELANKVYKEGEDTLHSKVANEPSVNVQMDNKEVRQPDEEFCGDGSTKPKNQVWKCLLPKEETILNEILTNTDKENLIENVSGNLVPNENHKPSLIAIENIPSVGNEDEKAFARRSISSLINICKNKTNTDDVQIYEIINEGSTSSKTNIQSSSNVTLVNVEGISEKSNSSQSLPSSRSITPNRRPHWGNINISGLENSPLESSGSKMDLTSSSDLVVVFKEVGERKQWTKNCEDIISVLSEAQIIESPMIQKHIKRQECKIDTMEILDTEAHISNSKHLDISNKSAVMNSTFTVSLQECDSDCKNLPSNFTSDSSPNAQTLSCETPSLQYSHLIYHPSTINRTFEIHNEGTNNDDNILSRTKEEICKTDVGVTVGNAVQASDNNCHKNTNLDKTTCNVGYGGSSNSNDFKVENKEEEGRNGSSACVTGTKIKAQEEIETACNNGKCLNETYTINESISDVTFTISNRQSNNTLKKTKGGLLGMLRMHMSPRPKRKLIVANSVSESAEEKIRKKITSELCSSKDGSIPVVKKKMIKSGLAGILQKLSSRQDINSEAADALEKGIIESTEICDKSNSDNDSSGESCALVQHTKNFGSKECTNSKTANTVVENNERSKNEDKGYLLFENPGVEKRANSPKSESTMIDCRFTRTSSQIMDTEQNLSTENCEHCRGKEMSVNTESNESSVVGERDFDKQKFEFMQTKTQATEECTYFRHSDKNMGLNTVEDLVSKSDLSSATNVDSASSDSGIDTQRTDFTCQSSSDTQSDYTVSSVTEGITSVAVKDDAHLIPLEENNTLPYIRDSKISVVTGDYSTKIENDSVDVVEDLAHTVLLEVIERAGRQASINDTMERYRDISPITPRNIHINMNSSGEVKGQDLQHQCGSDELPGFNQVCLSVPGSSQSEKCETGKEDTERLTNISEDYVSRNNQKIVSEGKTDATEFPNDNSFSDKVPYQINKHSKVTNSAVRPRPTLLCIGSNNNELITDLKLSLNLKMLQNEGILLNSNKDVLKFTREQNYILSQGSALSVPQNNMQYECSKNKVHLQGKGITGESETKSRARDKDYIYTDNSNEEDNSTASDEESEDFANLRQSMELLLNSREQLSTCDTKSLISTCTSSEVWHLDGDGAVVSGGGGGVYGWIEEQRAKLEDILGLELFMRAYHHLGEAQEREGCVVGEAITQVEEMLGQDYSHMAYDILQLVISEAVYHN